MADRPTWIGKTISGRYRIDELLGQGGMSAVYKAYDPNLRRVVAIKLIHSHLADDPRFLTRFTEEATAVAQLRHLNIVQVFDFAHDGDLYYMVQEFIPGETLQQRLRRLQKSGRHMLVSDAIRYTVQIANASGYAHLRGMVHRDIKPANIMITVQDQATLMDFGIVKITGGESHTATGAVVGTALYLSPELIRGESPDPRADIYSLGVTLFEMVSGRPPYEADSAMTLMMMHLNDPVPDLRQMRQGIPDSLVAVIEKAMQKNRLDRYQSMEEMAEALERLLQALPASPGVTEIEPSPARDEAPTPPVTTPKTRIDAGRTPEPEDAAQPPPPPPPITTPPTPPTPVFDAVARVSQPPTARAQSTAEAKPADTPTLMASPTPAAAIPPVGRAAGGAGEPPTPSLPAVSLPAAGRRAIPLAVWIGVGLTVVVLVAIGIFLASRGGSKAGQVVETEASATDTAQAAAIVPATDTPAPTETSLPTTTPTPAPTDTPTPTPTLGLPPTATFPAGIPFAFIKSITLDANNRYIVDYDTLEFQEKLPGVHVHFFFNTVPQDQAGHPGKGPWILYGGPRPFNGYRKSDRPAAATQMCILVANPDHSIQPDSGNCVILPDVNAAVAVFDDPCLAGPGPAYPALAQLEAGQVLQVNGISPDEAWWTVESPGNPRQSCWLERNRSVFSGDLSTLPLAEIPPAPEGSTTGMSVQITQITLDANGRYVVDFTTTGFTPALPGTHIHFFFDIFTADQVGSTGGGNRLMFGGASPFTGYTQADRPQGATQLCALVANPDHSVIEGSGNCSPLPDVDTSQSFPSMLNDARSQPVAFQESFDDNRNDWATGLSSSAELGSITRSIESGRYRWEVNGLEPSVWWAATDKVNAFG